MQKRVVVILALLLGIAATAVAAPAAGVKITNTRIVQAAKDTTVSYAGMKIFVPQGQTVILGQNSSGSMVLRGQDLKGVKINDSTITSQGATVLSVNPQNLVVAVSRGNEVSVTDANGRTAVLSQGAVVSAQDIRSSTATAVNTKEQQAAAKAQEKAAKEAAKAQAKAEKAAAKAEAKAQAQANQTAQNAVDTTVEVPAFVASTETSSAANEQAAQDTEETLSPSAPR